MLLHQDNGLILIGIWMKQFFSFKILYRALPFFLIVRYYTRRMSGIFLGFFLYENTYSCLYS